MSDTGGSAFPLRGFDGSTISDGMTLRDYFANAVDKDEFGDILYKHMTRDTGVALAGKYPIEPKSPATLEEMQDWRLDCIKWELRVRSAVRYMMADAMLAERERAK